MPGLKPRLPPYSIPSRGLRKGYCMWPIWRILAIRTLCVNIYKKAAKQFCTHVYTLTMQRNEDRPFQTRISRDFERVSWWALFLRCHPAVMSTTRLHHTETTDSCFRHRGFAIRTSCRHEETTMAIHQTHGGSVFVRHGWVGLSGLIVYIYFLLYWVGLYL
jgi:hypothetical protein